MNLPTTGPWWLGSYFENEGGDKVEVVSKGDRHRDHRIAVVDEAWSGSMMGNSKAPLITTSNVSSFGIILIC